MIMTRRVLIGLLAALVLLSLIGVVGAGAQAQSGTIRGTVFEDLNSDGACVGTGEPGLAGIPIEFVHESNARIVVQTVQDGSYSLVGIGFGTWQVAVQPGSGFVATSQQSFSVTISSDQPEVTGLDFCVERVTVTPTATSAPAATPTSASSLMPESGAGAPPTLLIVGAIGIALFALGAGIEAWRRRAS
jgi:hypothetical protein